MLSRSQQILLKRAQAEAGIEDGEYREHLATVSGLPDCRSSKDKRLTDEHLDALLGWFEAICWRMRDADPFFSVGQLARNAVFREREFWAIRNRKGNCSRDRYAVAALERRRAAAVAGLAQLGFGEGYCASIRKRLEGAGEVAFVGALERTLRSKLAKSKNQNPMKEGVVA